MALSPGTRVGAYDVVAPLGAGGMGEVYRARDTRLKREVALKILPDSFAADPDRLARFQREAEVLASLNHPNIAHVHGLEESNNGIRALVMELVSGEPLSAQLLRGPISLGEALPIARQIAEALEAAHERGIVHRDLKPANIMVTPEGQVKVLDFGLAKASVTDAHGAAALEMLNSPTITSPAALTMGGVVLGTAAYMSPEQAKGKIVDRRADIWAFGCVLYEMLTGRRPFDGEDVTEIIAAVISKDPDWSRLATDATPPAIERLIRRCLVRNKRNRLPDIAVARLEIDDVIGNAPAVARDPATDRRQARAFSRWWVAIATATALIAGIGIGRFALPGESRPPSAAPVVFTVPMPPGAALSLTQITTRAGGIALSRDGRQMAFTVSRPDGAPMIFVRKMDEVEARPLAGTDNAAFPFWSPDGERLAFCQQQKLKQIHIAGGGLLEIAPCPNTRTRGAWGVDNTILFVPEYQGDLVRVPAAGGPVERVLHGDLQVTSAAYFSPVWLDSKRFLIVRFAYTGNADAVAGLYIGSIGSPDLTPVVNGAVIDVAWNNGEIFMRRGENLVAQPFDSVGGRISGQPRTIATQVAAFDAAGGALAYLATERGLMQRHRIAWFGRDGKRLTETGALGTFRDPRLSPDGRSLAVLRSNERGIGEIWVYDLRRNIDVPVIAGDSAFNPVWWPDGRTIAAGTVRGIVRAPIGGSLTSPLFDNNAIGTPHDISPDGTTILYVPTGTATTLMARSLVDGSPPRQVGPTATSLSVDGAFSPDGRWVAYAVVERSSPRVYVTPYPNATQRFAVSGQSGRRPRWRHDGREIFFSGASIGNRSIVGVPVTWTSAGPEFGAAQTLVSLSGASTFGTMWDVSPDGQRFVVIEELEPDRSPITVRLIGRQ